MNDIITKQVKLRRTLKQTTAKNVSHQERISPLAHIQYRLELLKLCSP